MLKDLYLNNKKGLNFWNRALKIIPGGNSILSKRPERYGKDIWPIYFSKSKGCLIWDLDNKKYIDMAQMGIGASILGYNNNQVNNAVIKVIKKGINTTLNCTEEFELAKELLKRDNFASSVKFARSGGEAMAVATRIARAACANIKKNKIAFCGYHGWFDWYLATNIQNKNNLNSHLLEGLSPKGVPDELKNTIFPFKYNDINDFTRLISKKKKQIGIIVIESSRYNYPSKEFVEKINSIVRKNKLILICDEITTGFRVSNSGAYKKIGYKPHIVVYGKGLGNGFAISAIVGKKKIMNFSQETFISSSNWSERVGFVAAIETLNVIRKKRVWKHLNSIGKKISQGWKKIFKKYNLDIEVCNFHPLVTMKPHYGKLNNYILTYFIQEMLRSGYLVSASVYVSLAHNNNIIRKYLNNCDLVFKRISLLIKNKKIKKELLTKVRSDSFQRLN